MARASSEFTAPTSEDVESAARARRSLAEGKAFDVRDLPDVAKRLLTEILAATEAGEALTLVSVDAEFTLQEAARALNVSDAYIIGLIENEELPGRKLGAEYTLPAHAVLSRKHESRTKRRESLREMTAIDQKLGLL